MRAVNGIESGSSSSTVWVECMRLWSGRDTANGFVVGCLLVYGAWMEMKCPVVPVSAMNEVVVGEGPVGLLLTLFTRLQVEGKVMLVSMLEETGCPRSYSVMVWRCSGTQIASSSRLRWISLQPPSILKKVALTL